MVGYGRAAAIFAKPFSIRLAPDVYRGIFRDLRDCQDRHLARICRGPAASTFLTVWKEGRNTDQIRVIAARDVSRVVRESLFLLENATSFKKNKRNNDMSIAYYYY